jgi:hypothetical protein
MIYKLILSTKEEVSLSEQEFVNFKNNISANFIEFEAGIINPSFVVSVIIDEEASRQYNQELMMSLKLEELNKEDVSFIKNNHWLQGDIKTIKQMSKIIKKYNKTIK